jgi:ABC-2 type transport system permease protein
MTAVVLDPRRVRLTVPRLLRSEWSKLWSIRAPRWLLAAMVASPVALGLGRVAAVPIRTEALDLQGRQALLDALANGGLSVALLAAMLGVIVIAAEYTDDALATTLIAAPRRRLLMAVKVLPAAFAALAASAVGFTVAAVLALVVLTSRGYADLPTDLLFASGLHAVVAASIVSVFGVGVAAITRSSVAAVIAVAGAFLVAPSVLGQIGAPSALIHFLPANALEAAVRRWVVTPSDVEDGSIAADPAFGILTLAAWAAVALAAGLVVFGARTVVPQRAAGRPRATRAERFARPAAPLRLRFGGVLRSEALKLATMPATRWLLGLSALATIAIALRYANSVAIADVVPLPLIPGDLAVISDQQLSWVMATGFSVSELLLAAFGAVAFTSEFATGSIRPAVAAVPRRGVLVAAKVVVTVAAGAGVAAASTVLAAVVSVPGLAHGDFAPNLLSAAALETLVRCTIASAALVLLGCGVGMIARRPFAAVGTLMVLLYGVHFALMPLQVAGRGTPLVGVGNAHLAFPFTYTGLHYFGPNTEMAQWLEGGILQLLPDQALGIALLWGVAAVLVGWLVLRRRGV